MISRRSFGSLLLALGLTKVVGVSNAAADETKPLTSRLSRAVRFRNRLSSLLRQRPSRLQRPNRDEQRFGANAAYTKALPHNQNGSVSARSYLQLRRAISAGTKELFEAIELGGPKKLKNPLAAYANSPWGFDSCQYYVPPAPRLDSEDCAGDLLEVYWMALLRDIPFADYESSGDVAAAVADLGRFESYSTVTARTLFRGPTEGCIVGPYLSQFFYFDVPVGSLLLSQKQRSYQPGLNFLTDESSFRDAQNGFTATVTDREATARYQQTGRDLACYVHLDTLSQAFRNAALILRFKFNARFNSGHPYRSLSKMDGFSTFDYPHLLSMLDTAMTLAGQAVWFQKWRIHRRIRPEEVGGLVQNELVHGRQSPISRSVIESSAMAATFTAHGSYLIPQAYPEGCPPHPAYPSGHATVAGAAGTILKAFFDCALPFSEYADPVEPTVDGLGVQSYSGDDASSITINGEIDKLMFNQGLGRCHAGIHWRTDITEGIKLGEEVAIAYIRSMKGSTVESFRPKIRKVDGTVVTI